MELILDVRETPSKKKCAHKIRKRIHRTTMQKMFYPTKVRYSCQRCKKTFLN